MAKLLRITKELSTKRVQEIENYDYSLFSLINPSIKIQLIMNPIGGQVALKTLKELKEEIESYVVLPEQIDCNRVFNNKVKITETEKFVKNIDDGRRYLSYLNDYKKMKEAEELNKDFPREEREKLVRDLEQEIKKEYRKIETVGKINKTLRRASEVKINEKSSELRDILTTLEVPTEEYINNMLYMVATSKIAEIKKRIDSKIIYLEGVLK